MADWQQRFAEELRAWLDPVAATNGEPDKVIALLHSAGWHADAFAAGDQQNLADEFGQITAAVASLVEALRTPPDKVEAFLLEVGPGLVVVAQAIPKLADALPAGLPAAVSELPADLLNWLTIEWLRGRHPLVYTALRLIGVIRSDLLAEETFGGKVYRTRSAVPRFSHEGLVRLFQEPDVVLKEAFWKAGVLDADGALALALELWSFAEACGLTNFVTFTDPNEGFDPDQPIEGPEPDTMRISKVVPLTDETTTEFGVAVKAIDPAAGGPGALLTPFGEITGDFDLGVAKLGLQGTIRANPIQIDPAGVRQVDATQPPAALKMRLARGDATTPFVSVGKPGGIQFSIKTLALLGGLQFTPGKERATLGVELQNFRLVLAATEADGFLATLLPAEGITTESSLVIEWSTDGGVTFRGGSLTIALPLHLQLGPIEISNLVIELKPAGRELPIGVGATFGANLGPLAAVVEEVGVIIGLEFPQGGGNAGPMDATFSFKPPKGVGLSIDAGVVKGGGYLFIDPDRGEYAGALELTIQDFLSLKAIGLINTIMPDGSKGFSLLIIITAEFSPGIQLGYGFTLIGVGGLLGLNRTVVLEALALGVRTGAVNGLLFPTDVVRNAPRIISDMRVIFPPYNGKFLIGPMAKLGWGTPTLISLSLGVIIEIPGNIAILGVLKAILPDEDAAVLQLQVNFLGAIEFDKKRGWFFAALFESRIVFITIEGEMGMLIAVGSDANFVLSVGGFHPRFSPPPLPFPSPKRIALDILHTPVARIRGEAYFAITTNTAQFGARVELFFGYDSFSVEGHLALDALLRFNPFYLIVEISGGVSLKVFGAGCFSITLEFTLEGATPWRARGKGSVKVLGFKVSKSFDETWGDEQQTTLPPISVIPLLQIELNRPENWRALPPPSSNLLVSLRKLDLAPGELVLHPLGTLEVSQNQVPLGITIDKVGAQVPDDANHFTLAVTAGGFVRKSDAQRGFSPAQFKKMSDAQKLSAPAFANEKSGLTIGVDGQELQTGRAVRRSLRYELTTIDTLFRRFVLRFRILSSLLFTHLIKGSAVAKSVLSKRRRKELRPFDDRIVVADADFAVVNADTNAPAAAAPASFTSQAAAEEWLSALASSDPGTAATLQVMPRHEMPRAA